MNHKQVDIAHCGEEVCIKVEASGGEAPRLYGRHFDHTDMLVSKVSLGGYIFSIYRNERLGWTQSKFPCLNFPV